MTYGLAPARNQPTDPVEDLVFMLLTGFAVFTFTYDVALLVPLSLRAVLAISALACAVTLLAVLRSTLGFLRALFRHLATAAATPSSWLLGAFCLAAGLVGLLANRPDADDSFYLARAVLDWETWRWPIAPVYRFAFTDGAGGRFPSLPAWEHFWAALAGLLHLHPLSVYDRLAPFAGGMLVPFAWYCAFSRISHSRRAALTGAAAVLLLMLLDGTTHRGIGLFGLVRIWQGKVVLVAAIAPLALAVTLDTMRHGRAADWARLLLLGVVGIGLSTSAAFYLPILVGLAGGTFWLVYLPPTRIWQPPLASLAVFAYPALTVLPFYRELAGPDAIFASPIASDLRDILLVVYGSPLAPLVVAVGLAVLGLAIARRTRLLGWFTIWTAALTVPLAWPPSADFIVNRLTSADAMWRLAYASPALLALGAGFGSLMELRFWRPVAMAVLLAGGALAAGLALGHLPPSPFAAEGMRFPSLALKLPPGPLAASRVLLLRLPPGTMLAPRDLSTVMPQLSASQRLANFRQFDAPAQLVLDGKPALAAELTCAHDWISARPVACDPRAALAALAATGRLDTVVLDPAMDGRAAAEAILRAAGYAPVALPVPYLVYRRSTA